MAKRLVAASGMDCRTQRLKQTTATPRQRVPAALKPSGGGMTSKKTPTASPAAKRILFRVALLMFLFQ